MNKQKIPQILITILFLEIVFVKLPVTVTNIALAVVMLCTIVFATLIFVKKLTWKFLPQAILFFSLFILAMNLSSIRNILTAKTIEEQSFILRFMLLEKSNAVINLVVGIILEVFFYLVSEKGCVRLVEVNRAYIHDSSPMKSFDIDNREKSGEITKLQAKAERNQIKENMDIMSALDGSCKFLSGTIKALCCTYLITIIAGTLIAVMNNGMELWPALKNYSFFAVVNSACWTLPLIVVSFCISFLSSVFFNEQEKNTKLILERKSKYESAGCKLDDER